MAVQKLTPAVQFSQSRSRPWSGAELVNCYSEMAEGDKADTFAVMAIPGIEVFTTLSGAPVRGEHVMQGILYVVSGTSLYKVEADGTKTNLGTIPGETPVMMADNGTDLAIQSGTAGFVLSGGVLYDDVPNLPDVSNVVYIDGYFVWTIAGSDQFIISALNDGLSYDPIDVATVEGDPDDIVGCINDHRELQFYGSRTVEIWYNSGAADFPFARQGNAFIERGCFDRDSIKKIDNSVHFVGDDRVIYRLNGYEPVRISTHAIEFQIARAKWFRAFVVTELGHKQYILNTDLGTWGYDMATGAWHERRSYEKVNYRIGSSAEVYGKTIVGDSYTGDLYVYDFEINDEAGDPIIMMIQYPSLQTNRLWAKLYSFELQIQAGVGTIEEPNPQVTLAYSRDGGNTYSAEMHRPMGKMGEYFTRCIWRLGVVFRQLQIRVTFPSRVQRVVIAAFADVR